MEIHKNDPIKIQVRTIWQGKVGVRDRYIAQAKDERRSIIVSHKKQKMTLPIGGIKQRILFRSKEKFQDRFGNDPHHLYYFNWVPDGLNDAQLSFFQQNQADLEWFDNH